MSTEIICTIFVIDDFYVKRTGPQYDVLYEDSGLDEVQTFDPETLLEILSEDKTELVTNPPRSDWSDL
jgi:hypothetical protein